jgi:two-component sensor histidine kinase
MQNSVGADISNIVTTIVDPHFGADSTRLRASGPVVRLEAKQAVAVSMALHELCTNALKYGALSNSSGRIDLEWAIEEVRGQAVLQIQWQEMEGPATHPPKRRGFGTLLIEEALANDFGSSAKIEFASTGVVCTIRVMLPAEQQKTDKDESVALQ